MDLAVDGDVLGVEEDPDPSLTLIGVVAPVAPGERERLSETALGIVDDVGRATQDHVVLAVRDREAQPRVAAEVREPAPPVTRVENDPRVSERIPDDGLPDRPVRLARANDAIPGRVEEPVDLAAG